MKNRLYIITGTSTGIGFGLCKHFSSQGSRVFAGYRNDADREKLEQLGQGVKLIKLDITDEAHLISLNSALKAEIKEGDSLVLINNAGVAYSGPIELLDIETYRKQFEVNFFSTIRVTQVCLPFVRQTKGRIINISSVAGIVAKPYMNPYSSSKFALEAFTDSLRFELAQFNIPVVAVNPGAISTPIWDKARATKFPVPEDSVYYKDCNDFLDSMERGVKGALPVHAVVDAVDQAAHSKNPKDNYIVGGRLLKTVMAIVPFVPKKWIMAILRS